MLVFATVFGLSVEDLSESGGAFLGVEDLTFAKPVYPGDTLSAGLAGVGRTPLVVPAGSGRRQLEDRRASIRRTSG